MTKPAISKQRAATLAPKVKGMTWEQARDAVDLATNGELDAWQLDKLTDWAIDSQTK